MNAANDKRLRIWVARTQRRRRRAYDHVALRDGRVLEAMHGVLNYSNPGIYNAWFRTGTVADANNALVISGYSSYTAQYRPSLGRIFYDGFND